MSRRFRSPFLLFERRRRVRVSETPSRPRDWRGACRGEGGRRLRDRRAVCAARRSCLTHRWTPSLVNSLGAPLAKRAVCNCDWITGAGKKLKPRDCVWITCLYSRNGINWINARLRFGVNAVAGGSDERDSMLGAKARPGRGGENGRTIPLGAAAGYGDHREADDNQAVLHRRASETANDPKLRDRGGWRGSCGVERRKRQRT